MSKTVRFALIGTGNISGIHAEAIREIPGAELVAAYSLAGMDAFCQKWACQPAASLDALLARPDIDAVCITTPSGLHGESAIAALNAGKHVLCEKPIEITVEKIDAMLAAANKSGTILAAVFQSRFGEGAQTVKRAVDAGRFGRLTMCSAYIKWWRTQAYYDSGAWRGTWEIDGGGALMNQGVHAIDLLTWFAGVPSEVKANIATLAHDRIAVEDTAVAALKFPSGALGVIEGATSTYPGAGGRQHQVLAVRAGASRGRTDSQWRRWREHRRRRRKSARNQHRRPPAPDRGPLQRHPRKPAAGHRRSRCAQCRGRHPRHLPERADRSDRDRFLTPMKIIAAHYRTGETWEFSLSGRRVAGRRRVRAKAAAVFGPGFVDLQCNGFMGVDFNHPDDTGEVCAGAIRALWETGVAHVLPTLITASREWFRENIEQLNEALSLDANVARSVPG